MTPTRRSRCRSHRTTLDAVLDGRERQAALQALELHADDCEECAHALSESRALRAALDALPAPEFARSSDDAFVAAVMGRVDGDVPAAPERSPWRVAGPVALVVAAAAAVAVIARLDRSPVVETTTEVVGVSEPVAPDVNPEGNAVVTDAVTALPPVVHEASPSAAPDELAAVLDAIDSEGTYDPHAPLAATEFVHDVRSRIEGDLSAAARVLLAGRETPRRAALAARLLGPGADYRDRDLLTEAIGSVGAPAAFALADRGGSGVERLWRVALGDDEAARLAQTTLCLLAGEGDADRSPFERMPRSTPLSIVAPVVAADRSNGATRALDEFLASGDPIWLSVLIEHDLCLGAIDDAVSGRVRSRDHRRMLAVIARSGATSAVDFVVASMERGEIEAVDTLAALPCDVVLEHLVEATKAGLLRADIEESAWRALARAGATEIEALVIGWRPERSRDIAVILDALVRAGTLGPEDGARASARELVISLAALDGADPRVRVAALLHVSSSTDAGVVLSDVELEHLEHLLAAPDLDVAAAAWLVRAADETRAAAAPTNVRRALDRGGDPSVRLLRVARALDRDRAVAARHARGSATL